MPTEVINDPQMNRYELLLDGEHVGRSDYQLRDNTIVFTHTEIDPGYQDGGYGGELVRGALNLVRAESELRVVASCPFVAKWIELHPDYQDLLER